jgi:hypothetical protein
MPDPSDPNDWRDLASIDPSWAAEPSSQYVTTPRAPRPALVVALAITIAGLLAASVAAVAALTGPASNTPQQAVSGLLTAAANADVLGVLDHLAPAERDIVSGFLTDGVSDLKRLGVLAPATDLHHIAGVSLSFDNVTMTTTSLRSDLSAVTITGGTVHSHVDPAKVSDKTSPLHVTTPIVTVRQGDTWYVSLGYTVAESARHRTGKEIPAIGVKAVGAPSPTEAVDQFIRAAAALDVRRLIELTPPDEMAALHDYAPLFLAKLDDQIAKLRAGPKAPTVTITDLTLNAKSHRGGQLVKISHFGMRISSGGTTVEFAPGTKCLKVTSNDATPPSFPGQCGTHAPFSLGSSSTCSATSSSVAVAPLCINATSSPDGSPSPYDGFKALSGIHPDLGIVAVERGGAWYVSPLRTGLDDLEAILHALTPDILQSLTKGLGAFSLLALTFALAGRSSSQSFSTVGGSIGSTGSVSTGPSPIGTKLQRPTFSTCVNGMQTVTFPTTPGQSTPPPFTIPCKSTP